MDNSLDDQSLSISFRKSIDFEDQCLDACLRRHDKRKSIRFKFYQCFSAVVELACNDKLTLMCIDNFFAD